MSKPVTSRRQGSGVHMFLRLMMRAAFVRKGRALSALMAVVVAAAVATAMLNLYADVESKMRKEFRSYGANVVVVAKDGQSLPADALALIQSALGGRGVAVPYAYAVARNKDGSPVVVAGTDFDLVRKVNTFWAVSAWPSGPNQALLGTRARSVAADGKPFTLTFEGRALQLIPAGTVRTGADEDSRIYLSLPEFTAWTHVNPSSIEIAATGAPSEIQTTVQRLAAALPQAEVRPVRQIVEGEARVLGKTRMSLLASALVIILTAALCVVATLTTWVLDRRRDFAIMKALGASETLINGFFAAEAAAMGAVGALIGFAVGIAVAAWIGEANFHSAITPRFTVLPVVFFGSVAVAMISAILPISLLRRVEPAMILRGE